MQPLRRWRILPFAAMLSVAGLPLYIHLPRFAGAELGLSLSTVGIILIAIRVLDFGQDPALGWMVDRWPRARPLFAALACAALGGGFLLLFSVPPPIAPVLWVTLLLVVIFTAYSLATILLYGQTEAIAAQEGPGGTGHLGVAAWRETGLVLGVLVAAAAPSLLALLAGDDLTYPLFGLLIAALALAGGWCARPLWRLRAPKAAPLTLSALVASGGVSLLLLACLNALPTALTSTLFLFFVEDRLRLPDLAGPFLILFFLSAGVAAPLWARAAARFGNWPVLVSGMTLTILAFAGAGLLPAGAALGFAVICVASGAALGADLVILPVLFSTALARAGLSSGQAFGLWSMATKLSLALAAVATLPLLQSYGYVPGGENTPKALQVLNISYAILPCGMKLIALLAVLTRRVPVI
jgi:glycoside/pentoside/hexuronide:cation symporter, GPH family|tara:strand:- start:96 stop:1331 length:1236 start_codon:yes stop_codon:yes gene_type:complete